MRSQMLRQLLYFPRVAILDFTTIEISNPADWTLLALALALFTKSET